jgi:GNAT superfamily N-acetyltransferase
MSFTIDDDMTSEEAAFIQRKLVEFADSHAAPRDGRNIGVVLRDAGGDVVGGVRAYKVWDRLKIDAFWLGEGLRRKGWGTQLLSRLEDIARDLGCRNAVLDTFDFEARGFYERNGYTVVGETKDFPEGHSQFHLEKRL